MDSLQVFLKLDDIAPERLISVKTALVKFFYDKGFYFDVVSRLEEIYDNFTFNNIISIWSGENVNIYDESPLFLSEEERLIVSDIIYNPIISLAGEYEGILGRIYEKTLSSDNKKAKGITYTPEDISEFMIDIIRRNAGKEDKFIDPACGCGVFLEGFYDALIGICFTDSNTETIKAAHERILTESIYGCDTSPEACAISKIILALKYKDCVLPANIVCCDSLLSIPVSFGEIKFDWIMTNPPYLGHKQTDNTYKKRLKEKYGEVYYEKADLSYCFFKLGHNLLKTGGELLFVTGRYFAQSKFADKLRGFILKNFSIKMVIDFYGVRPFKNAGIDPMILQMKKGCEDNNIFEVMKFSPDDSFDISSAYDRLDERLIINQNELSEEGFNFLDEKQKKLTSAIEEKCSLSLADTGAFFQGIISGCDKAFVVHDSSLIYQKCIDECGVKWIKSTEIKPEGVNFSGKYLLYTNDIEDISYMPNTMVKLEIYKGILSKRRECRNGIRKWYELQWGRKKESFTEPKIIFAYKNHRNCFLYDTSGYFFSADIYGYSLNDEYGDKLKYDKLVFLLNSPVYDAYFKTFAKKLGGSLYEYYPNTLSKIKLPPVEDINSFNTNEEIIRYFLGG